MVSFIRNVSFDCPDPYALAQFWSEVVGHPLHSDFVPSDSEVVIEPPGGPRLFFQAVPEGKPDEPRTGLHLDLMPTLGTRAEEVDRLVGLGATVVSDERKPDGTGWVTLADPEGNQFRVERSPTERV